MHLNKTLKMVALLLLLMGFTAACGQQSLPVEPGEQAPENTIPGANNRPAGSNNGYAAPGDSPPQSYPQPTEVEPMIVEGYPGPESGGDTGPVFMIDRPVLTGAVELSGSGQANIPISIISISYSGEELGSAVIDGNGRFSVQLVRPLEEKETVAISLADLTLREQFFDSPGATDIPMIGFILDIISAEGG